VNGWRDSPAPGIPANVQGFIHYGKKSWQTEHSGEDPAWVSPTSGFPGNGAWSLALRIQQALTIGQESAWSYWQMTDGNPVGASTLTDATTLQNSPKYIAAKHFFRYIRPNSIRVTATVTSSTMITASAFLHTDNGTMTVVLVNSSNRPVQAAIESPVKPAGIPSWQTFTSSGGSYWQVSTSSIANGSASVTIPGYGLVTLYGVAPSGAPPSIASQPASQAVGLGQTAMFAVTAQGTAPLSYQWRLSSTNLADNGRITGSESNLLVVAGGLASDAGDYQVVVTNVYGSTTSAAAMLTVILPPVFQGVMQGNGALSLAWSATAGQRYQVQSKTNLGQANWTDGVIVIATNSMASASDALTASGQRFYRIKWAP
jgi:hypothetical protein